MTQRFENDESRTYELFITLVQGQVPECRRNSTNNSVHFHPKELYKDRESLFFPNCCSDLNTGLPVAGG